MWWRAVCGGVSGAILTYLFDPDRGRHRRAELRDKTVKHVRHVHRRATHLVGDALNRALGTFSEWRARVNPVSVADEVLLERVRAELGHVVRQPRGIEVTVEEGIVRLRGRVLPDEKQAVVAALRHVPGIWALVDDVDEHGWIVSGRTDAQPAADRPTRVPATSPSGPKSRSG
jgi:hypothetical protein